MTSREASARLGGRVRSVPSGPSEFLAERVASGLHVKGGRISGARSIFRRGKGVIECYLSFDPARVDAVTGCKTSLFGLGLLNLTISAEIR